ncbi:unnamed protein product [Brassica napus]|uniref:(rape) hypothetical protein n=1 Tax=Brassica napus TaxID=3708 RepID=A0A816JNR0_BRANA|nr:unnamed protein product [Brassica napus]
MDEYRNGAENLRWIRQMSLMVEEITKPLCGLKTSELSW